MTRTLLKYQRVGANKQICEADGPMRSTKEDAENLCGIFAASVTYAISFSSD